MGTFLNRPATVEKVKEVISQAEKEIILIVPYIKLSDAVYERLQAANDRGVEIIVIYREGKLQSEEWRKLSALVNVNLFYHAEIHAKCYLNEMDLIITSMNLYDYSEKYNREMGILISNSTYSQDVAYKAALQEIREVLQTASLEKKSKRTLATGFVSQLLRPQCEMLFASCQLLNRYFDNKKFEVIDNNDKGDLKCANYYENIHAFIDPDFSFPVNTETGDFTIRRAAFEFAWDETKRKAVQQAFWTPATEYMFQGFKVYWDYFSKSLTIYRDQYNFPMWKQFGQEETILRFKEGIEMVGTFVRHLERELR